MTSLVVRIRVMPPLSRVVAETVWHPSQRTEEREDGSIILRASVPDARPPAAWSYLKNVQHNPIVAAITGGLAPCEGNMSIVHSDRGNQEYLFFTFTSTVTGNGVTYVVADVDKFLAAIRKATESRETVKPGVVCHEGVDMADGSRSNYILRMLEDGALTMELERNGIGILYVLAERDVDGLLNLAGER